MRIQLPLCLPNNRGRMLTKARTASHNLQSGASTILGGPERLSGRTARNNAITKTTARTSRIGSLLAMAN